MIRVMRRPACPVAFDTDDKATLAPRVTLKMLDPNPMFADQFATTVPTSVYLSPWNTPARFKYPVPDRSPMIQLPCAASIRVLVLFPELSVHPLKLDAPAAPSSITVV